MDIKQEHSSMVTTLAKDGTAILATMTSTNMHNLHMVVGMAGEAGELMDAIFKTKIDTVNVLEELGDYEFYFEGLRQGYGIACSWEDINLNRHMGVELGTQAYIELIVRVLAIESSNVLDLVKKQVIYNKGTIGSANLARQFDEIEFCLFAIRDHFDFLREEVLEHNINKLSKGDGKTKPRYAGGKYTDDAANERADKHDPNYVNNQIEAQDELNENARDWVDNTVIDEDRS